MIVVKRDPVPAVVPPSTYDITGLTADEMRALWALSNWTSVASKAVAARSSIATEAKIKETLRNLWAALQGSGAI